jgi:SAM-dependent methyltransferase
MAKIAAENRSSNWNEVYKRKGKLQYEYDPLVEKSTIPLFKEHKVGKILDLGCGTGRHAEVFAKNDFRIVGIDISEVATNISIETLKDLRTSFFVGDMKDIKFPDDYFDAVFCFQVIHHAKTYEVWKTLDEITRVLKKNGILFITFPSLRENEHIFKDGTGIEPNTYVNLDCLDGIVPHHFFEEKEIQSLFDNRYKIISTNKRDIFVEHENTSWNYYVVAAQKIKGA